MNTTTRSTFARPLFAPFSVDELDAMTLAQITTHVDRYTTIIEFLKGEAFIASGPVEHEIDMKLDRLTDTLFCLWAWAEDKATLERCEVGALAYQFAA